MGTLEEESKPNQGGFAAKWGVFTTIASFCVYVLGYLAIRFQLTALGVGTDLELLDERYFFEGAKFLVYLVATLPVVVFYGLPVAALGWLALRRLPAGRDRLERWWARPVIPLTAGIVASALMIQFVMRQCLAFDNLLLRDSLPAPAWFASILTDASDAPAQVYFTLLVAGMLVLGVLVLALGPWQAAPPLHRGLVLLLGLLLGIQFLLLPINYGIVTGARARPRLAPGPEAAPVEPGATAWLIWEGKTGVTFLVRDRQARRKLLTVPRDKVERVEIVAFDSLQAMREPSPVPPDPGEHRGWESFARLFVPPSPLNQRDPLPDDVNGSIYIVPSGGGEVQPVSKEDGYVSPVFEPGDDALLALRGDRLMRIDLAGGAPREIGSLPGAAKLIAFDPEAPDKLLFLADVKTRPRIGWFDLAAKTSGTVAEIPPDKQGQWGLKYLRDDDRQAPGARLLVKVKDAQAFWTDVFIQREGQAELNLTRGGDMDSRQPTLSHNGRHVAFIRVSRSR
jgi:hypothetical protein